MDWLAVRLVNLKAPVPLGFCATDSWVSSLDSMARLVVARPASRPASGPARCSTTVLGSGASTDETEARVAAATAAVALSWMRSSDDFTSAERERLAVVELHALAQGQRQGLVVVGVLPLLGQARHHVEVGVELGQRAVHLLEHVQGLELGAFHGSSVLGSAV